VNSQIDFYALKTGFTSSLSVFIALLNSRLEYNASAIVLKTKNQHGKILESLIDSLLSKKARLFILLTASKTCIHY